MHPNLSPSRIKHTRMNHPFLELLEEIERPAPPAGAFEAVMRRLAWERRASSLRRRIAITGIATVTLAALTAWTLSVVRDAMRISGSFEYLSLIFYDAGAVLSHSGSFAYSVLESLPSGLLAGLLLASLCFAVAVRLLVRDTRLALHRPHAFNA